MIRRWAFFLFFFSFFFCILIPSRIKRTDVGKLINKSLGDVTVRSHSDGAGEGGGGMFCWLILGQHLNSEAC